MLIVSIIKCLKLTIMQGAVSLSFKAIGQNKGHLIPRYFFAIFIFPLGNFLYEYSVCWSYLPTLLQFFLQLLSVPSQLYPSLFLFDAFLRMHEFQFLFFTSQLYTGRERGTAVFSNPLLKIRALSLSGGNIKTQTAQISNTLRVGVSRCQDQISGVHASLSEITRLDYLSVLILLFP